MSAHYVTTRGVRWTAIGNMLVINNGGVQVQPQEVIDELNAVAAERESLTKESARFCEAITRLVSHRHRLLVALSALLDHQRDPKEDAEVFVAERLRLMRLAREARDLVKKEATEG